MSGAAINYLRYTGRKRISDTLSLVAVDWFIIISWNMGLTGRIAVNKIEGRIKHIRKTTIPLQGLKKKTSKELFGIQQVKIVLILNNVIREETLKS